MNCLRLHNGHEIEYRLIGAPSEETPTLVFLHEGLGSVSLWRDFPDRLARACGLPGLVYSRYGYGRSTPFETPPGIDFMHTAARDELPAVLAAVGVGPAVLVGHSDGASIALVHAGESGAPPLAVVAMAPHLFVEPICIEAIAATTAGFDTSGLRERLGRHHLDAARTFGGWSGVWLSGGFPAWSIEAQVARIRCPVFAIQGSRDQYGTMRQIHRIAELAPDTMLLELPGVRHSPHLECTEHLVAVVSGWLRCRLARSE
ncbi:MAG: alpha/beta hydrolase [Burkholderiaceae bacterium]